MHAALLPASQSPVNSTIPADVAKALADGKQLRREGRLAQAILTFQKAAGSAHLAGDYPDEAKALLGAGACQIRLFLYRPALQTIGQAEELAIRGKNLDVAGGAASNLATIYSELGDFERAEKSAAEAATFLQSSPSKEYLVRAIANQAWIKSELKKFSEASKLYEEGIAIAQAANLPAEEARLWDQRGRLWLETGDLPNAEADLAEAYRLRILAHNEADLAVTRISLAELEQKKRHYPESLRLLDEALASNSLLLATIPSFEIRAIRARTLAGLGRTNDALREFRAAVDAANQWRQSALPGDISSTRTVSYKHLYQVYQDCVDLMANAAITRPDGSLARDAFEVLSQNRAASLREQLRRAYEQQDRLPPHYYELLSELRMAQSRATLGKQAEDEHKTEELRLELDDLENKIGFESKNFASADEKRSSQKSLRDIQARLSKSELLLSFCLGKDRSYLWAITGEQVSLYQLPAESEIGKRADVFSEAIRDNKPFEASAKALSQELFSRLDDAAWRRPEWLIVADGPLLNGVPFSALLQFRSGRSSRNVSAVQEIRILPSAALLLSPKGPAPNSVFVGIGDPIYNSADTRIGRNQPFIPARSLRNVSVLARLAGSGREVRTVAQLTNLQTRQVLTGPNASSERLSEALQQSPAVVHFAVHVVSPEERPEEAALALSVTRDGLPELLTSETVAAYRVPGSLVILNGCSSNQGKTLPSAGVMGLSRAWLLAGAEAVIATSWPIPDDSGEFFSAFYRHFNSRTLNTSSVTQRAGAALHEAQLEMQHSGGYRSKPSFWAAYSVIAKE